MINWNFTQTNLTTTAAYRPTTTTLSLQQVLFVSILTYVDYVNRIFSFAMFIIYFAAVAMFKEMRTLNLLYVHHANFVGFIFVFMYIIYFSTSAPNSTDPRVNDLLCRITEVVWGVLKYLRSHSLLLIALYRLVAVYFHELFKLVNKSYLNIIIPIAVLWSTAILIFVGTKFGFNTTYGSLYCIDGFSTDPVATVNYLIVSSLLCIVLPFSLNILIYWFIRLKLSKMSTRTKSRSSLEMSVFKSRVSTVNGESSTQTRSSSIKSERAEMQKNQRFNLQLIALNTCDIMCFVMSFILSFRYIIVDFNQKFYYFRQLLRIFNIFFQAMIPVLSLYFNPNISRSSLKRFFISRVAIIKKKRLGFFE